MSKLGYDDVLLVPEFSDVDMSSDKSLSVVPPNFYNRFKLRVPIMSAAMDTVTEKNMAGAMNKIGGIGVIHRNCSSIEQSNMLINVDWGGAAVAVGLSLSDLDARITECEARTYLWVIDVAHAHRPATVEVIKRLKDTGIPIVAGNVVTPSGVEYLAKAGADAVKVGIGSGSICTTRQVTGVGYPQFSAVYECAKVGVPIIADGGVHRPGDMVKAFVAGAEMVMLGNALAGTLESPGDVIDREDGRKFKVYRGMGSKAVLDSQLNSRYFNTAEKTPEGVSGLVPYKGTVKEVIDHFIGGLKSAMCYLGCRTLLELREVMWVEITPSTVAKHGPYDIFVHKGHQEDWT